MIKIKEAVIVEGKYDIIKLSSIIDAPIIPTNGFRIFNDKERLSLIRQLAKARGILVMTDSDGAGFVIRNFLNGAVDKNCIKHCYIPQIQGKEKRKASPSKEGTLGVEGLSEEVILASLKKSGATILDSTGDNKRREEEKITKSDLYEIGLTGRENSKQLREKLLKHLQMPLYMTTNAMLTALNCLYTKAELTEIIKELE